MTSKTSSLFSGAFVLLIATLNAHAAPSIDSVEKEFKKLKAPPAAVALAQLERALEQGRFAVAKKSLAAIKRDRNWIDYAYEREAEIALRQFHASESKATSLIPSLRSARDSLGHLEMDQAYSPFISQLPVKLAQVELALGVAYFQSKKNAEATSVFESAFQRLALASALSWVTPNSLKAYVTICQTKPGPFCAQWIRRLGTSFPKNTAEGKELAQYTGPKDFATAWKKSSEAPGATEVFSAQATHGTVPYKSPDADQAAMDSAFALIWSHKNRDAQQALEQWLTNFPRSNQRARAHYWLAASLKELGKSDEEKASFTSLLHEAPLSFYGILAAHELGQSPRELMSSDVPGAVFTDASLTPMESVRIRRAEALLRAGAPELAAFELKEIRGKDSGSSEFLVYLAWLHQQSGSYLGCFRVLQLLIDRGSSYAQTQWALKLIFPTPYLETIQKVGNDLGVDPVLMLSLIKQESAFETQALSVSGASGLMQLMPATASDVDGKISGADLKQIEVNVRTGTRYLKQLLNKYNGSIALALAAYNAGPGNVDKWLTVEGSNRGLLDFIERIPFKETRDYVTSIIRNYTWYAPVVPGGDPLKPMDAFWRPVVATPSPAFSATPTASPTSP